MLWVIIIKVKIMDNPNFLSSIRSPKSSSDNQSPFQTFQQFVKNQNHSQLFTPLPEKSPSNANSLHTHHFPQYTTLEDSQPIQPQQHQRQKYTYLSNKKKAILLASFIIMLILFYQQIVVALFMREYAGQVGDELQSSYPDNLQHLLWIKRYYQAKMELQAKENMQKQKGFKRMDKTMEDFVRRVKRQMKKHEAKMYDEVGSTSLEQLPICIYIPSSSASTPKTIKSIIQTSYKNKRIIVHKSNYIQQLIQKDLDIVEINQQPSSHDDIKNILIHNCQQSSIIMFLNEPIIRQTLSKINQIHQKWNIYLTFSERDRVLEVHSFYLRIYELFCLQLQAHLQQHGQDVGFGDREQLALALLELTARRAKKIQQDLIFIYKTSYAYLLVNPTNPAPLIRIPFTTLTRLSQDFPFSLLHNQEHYNAMRYTPKQKLESLNMSMQKMNRALQLQDLLYLPHNHYLSSRQLALYNRTYSTCEYMQKQLRFCIAILSHNNIQNNRYKKVLLSIFMQKYQNYHIVFFDDFSDDGTLEMSMEFARSRGMLSKVVFVKNLERKYATYNIVNAAFNFCGEDQIQVLVDGDDELIGSHVLNLLNGLYQKDPSKWLIYTSFKTNLFQFGTSHQSTNKEGQKIIWKSGHRAGDHYMGQLRSFKTKLLRLIPKKYHQNEFGYWLDTVYDDALQHCFFEMGAPKHVQYVPEICYEYNREYGANDDSSQQKLFNRQNTYEYLLKLEALSEVEDIEKAQINRQMKQIFEKQLSSNTFKIFKEQAK